MLDVAYREDACRVQTGDADQNFAALRHLALTVLKHDHSVKIGIKAKRLKVGGIMPISSTCSLNKMRLPGNFGKTYGKPLSAGIKYFNFFTCQFGNIGGAHACWLTVLAPMRK